MKNSINKTADEMFEDLTDEECLDFAVDMLANQVMKWRLWIETKHLWKEKNDVCMDF